MKSYKLANIKMELKDNSPIVEDPEKQESVEDIDAIADILLDAYIDDEGNILHYSDIDIRHRYSDSDAGKKLGLDDIGLDEAATYKPSVISLLIETLFKKSEASKSVLTKLVAIKIIADLRRDGYDEGISPLSADTGLKDLSDNEGESYFVRQYAKYFHLMRPGLAFEQDKEEELQAIADLPSWSEMHQSQFDVLRFRFNDKMLNKLNHDSADVDYGAPSTMTDSDHAYPWQEVEADIDGKYFRGDYLTTVIAPGIIGVFSAQGYLVGWQEVGEDFLNNPEHTELSLNETASLQDQIQFENPKEDLAMFKILMSLDLRSAIESDFNIDLSKLNLRTQYQFLKYIKSNTTEQMKPAQDFVQKVSGPDQRLERMKAFLSLESDQVNGDKFIEIGNSLDPEEAQKLFSTYARLVDQATEKAGQIYAELSDKQPEVEISEQWIYQSLLARANALITESHLKLQDQRLDVDEMLQDLEKESAFQEVLRAQFLRIANLLSQDDVDLSKYRHEQELIASSQGKAGENESVYLRALNAMGRLKPLPELYWKVDRNSAEYNQRLGVDIFGLMKGFTQDAAGRKTVLEFGPGSGIAKHERSQKGIRDRYEEYAMSDALYYDIAGIIGKLIDLKKLETKLGRQITPEEQKSFIEYIKAAILIESGQTGSDSIVYDETVRTEIQKDPNRLKPILLTAGERMSMAEAVPTDQAEETPEGPRYREKLRVSEQTNNWQKARELLIEGITDYLSDDFYEVDAYELLDAHPAGIIVGDFGQIGKLQDEQIDLALGVRSTVYVERERYAQFISEVYQKLKSGGIYIDDNVRENFGRYYRIDELKTAQELINDLSGQDGKSADFAIYLVLGPGVEGEDYREGDSPLAIVVGKEMADHSLIEANLMPNCRMVKLNDVASNTEYLKSLGPDNDDADQSDQKIAA
ncbi:MAG: hypothetical protein WC693_03185 [Patescibacteria group bacterium]|jgi:hypothetical protein